MLLESFEAAGFKDEIAAIGDPLFGGETSLYIEEIINKKSDHKIFAVFRGEKVSGFLILSAVLDEAEILEVAVSENLRRKGIASELMEEILDWCKKNGIGRILLEVRKSNFAAINCYKRFGFVKDGFRKNYYRNPSEDAVLMSKKLSGAS